MIFQPENFQQLSKNVNFGQLMPCPQNKKLCFVIVKKEFVMLHPYPDIIYTILHGDNSVLLACHLIKIKRKVQL